MAVVALLVALPADSAWAISFPIPVLNTHAFGPLPYPGGGTYCGRILNGSYGSVVFSQPQSWVNYGGTCNACWPRPSGDMQANVDAMDRFGNVIASSGFIYNLPTTCYANASAPQISNAASYRCWGVWALTTFNPFVTFIARS